MGRPGQTRFTGECPVAVLMGGNVVDSRSPSGGRRAHCWVLKGQPQWSPDRVVRVPRVWWVFFVRVRAWCYTACTLCVGLVVALVVWGSVGCL